MACHDCDCGKKEREVAAAKDKKENPERIVLYDANADSGCGSCPSNQSSVEPEDDSVADKINEWILASGLDVVKVFVKKLDNFYALPEYKTEGAAAMDLYSSEDIFVPMSAITVVSTGIAMAIPEGYEAQVRPRSGLSLNGVMVANSPGTIDSDYRGEIKVIFANFGYDTTSQSSDVKGWNVKRGDRIAQILFAPVTKAKLEVVQDLNVTGRNHGGFGSTGL